ncbi:MAG: protein-glutamate methylesterase/protein-glutamine glutaminase [Bacillota bacterium]
MAVAKKIRVLIVDDSPLLREILARGISTDPQIEVVARAKDAYEARDKIIEFNPDVMTCDIQMPKMNGIEFIKRLIPQYSLPVIVVSSISEAVFDALNAGAVDFVAKPTVNSLSCREAFIEDITHKIKVAFRANISKGKKLPVSKDTNLLIPEVLNKKIIAIGASTGGTEAIFSVLKGLPARVPGIVIVQHIPPGFSTMFAERLDKQLELSVKEAQEGDYVEPGRVLLAPGNKHMTLRKLGSRYKVECKSGEKVNGHCPSVDMLFYSVAKWAGKDAIGIILTGMGKDGAKGLLAMRQNGARTLGQDEKSSVVYGMPKIAYEIAAVERQVSLASIPSALMQILKEKTE